MRQPRRSVRFPTRCAPRQPNPESSSMVPPTQDSHSITAPLRLTAEVAYKQLSPLQKNYATCCGTYCFPIHHMVELARQRSKICSLRWLLLELTPGVAEHRGSSFCPKKWTLHSGEISRPLSSSTHQSDRSPCRPTASPRNRSWSRRT